MKKQSISQIKQLIITRPKNQAGNLIGDISAVIDESIGLKHLPLLQIKPLEFVPPDLTDLRGVIFISGNAAKYFFANCQLRQLKILAVGENTAQQVEALSGQSVVYPQQMNAEGLLALSELSEVKNEKWLIIKGEGGRPLIYQELSNRGAKVVELNVYQRTLPDFETQQKIIQANIEKPVWIISSAEALNHLHGILGLAENSGHATPVIITSDRLADLAIQKGFVIIEQSSGASETQLLECIKTLIQWQKTKD